MASLSVTLPDPMVEFVDGLVRSSGFQDRSAVFEAAIADWQDRLAALNAAIDEGLDDVDAGRVVEVPDTKAWLDTLGRG